MKMIIIRHGESEANYENYWTGWLDVPLTEKGRQQAAVAGTKIAAAGIIFDGAYTSVLQRAMITCQTVLEVCDQLYIPVTKSWRLNERHYGALVGKNKKQMEKEFGAEQVKKWRRGYYEMPPRLEQNQLDRRYAYLDPQTIPHAENLAMTVQRVCLYGKMRLPRSYCNKRTFWFVAMATVCGH